MTETTPVELLVCTTCRRGLPVEEDDQRPGTLLHKALTEAELRWMMTREWARTGDDALWRRSKLGLRLSPEQRDSVARWMRDNRTAAATEAA